MLTRKNVSLIIVFIALACQAIAQPAIGIPDIKSYTRNNYNAAPEIWDIGQDKNGILYFANDEGLLTFDGSYWKTYQLPNKAAIRAIVIDPSGRIYCGGQDEVGYFFPDNNGILKFHSLKALLPKKARQFADIWSIVLYNNGVFFRTVESIFKLEGNSFKTFDASGGWRLLTKAGSGLYAWDKHSGFVVFKGGLWQHCYGATPAAGPQITGVVDYGKDTLLITTLNEGVFLMNGPSLNKKKTAIDNILTADRVTCARKISADRFAIGTAAKGLFIIDGSGNLIEHFSTNEGLQDNSIHSIMVDHDKNLWVGSENGVDFVNYNTSVTHIYTSRENRLKSNAAVVFDKKLYVGTSNGLFSIPVNQQDDISKVTGFFTKVKNTNGQVYSLTPINGSLLIGHQDGAKVLQGDAAKPVTSGQGAWMFSPVPNTRDIIAGTYTGLRLLQANGSNFTDAGKISGIYESLATIALDNHNVIWVSHPYRGIYKIRLSPDRKQIVGYSQYADKEGLPSIQNNHVYFIKNKIIAATEKGIYEYNANQNKFVASPFYKSILGDAAIEYLTEDTGGNTWFISNQQVGVIDFSKRQANKPYAVTYFPELAGQMVKGSGFIFPYNAENIFAGSNNAIFHLNYRRYTASANKLNVLLTSVKTIAEKDSVIFGGYFMKNGHVSGAQNAKNTPTVTKHWNSFHFEYSSTLFAQKSNIEYSYKLEGFDKDYSSWSAKTEKDYTNLPYGTFTFLVRAHNNLGNASAPVSYTFTVKPAWYQTPWAYFWYTVMIAAAIARAAYTQRKKFELHQRRHDDEQRRLQYLHSLELDRSEKEIIALKNSNLETEISYKNKELATLTMHLVDRGRLLLNIKDELLTLTKKLNIPDPAYQFRSVFKLLGDTDKNSDDWNHFAMYFDQVHNNFLSTMKTKFPNLSSTDLKLCAYLRLNLTSKEIAQLLNISLKGVEISRYRVRKKLGLATEVHLYDFLIEVTS